MINLLEINGLYKEQKNNIINDITLKLEKGNSISIECINELSDVLINLILGKEMPAKGEIYIAGEKHTDYVKNNLRNIGVIFREEGFYEGLTIENYMKFYSSIINSQVDYKEIMLKLALLDIGDIKINKLTYSQKRRLSFARERLKEPELMIFQEPILNMDREGSKIIMENIEELCSKGTAVLNTSVSYKDIMLLGRKSYILDENGLKEIQGNIDDMSTVNDNNEYKKPIYKVEKIPAKVDERILLFDPVEIDYVESEQGISNLNIRGEKFPCILSLAELENRLKYFGFFRCHRSYLVNLQKVREVITWTRNSYSLSLDDKAKSSIPLSKGRIKDLKDVLKI